MAAQKQPAPTDPPGEQAVSGTPLSGLTLDALRDLMRTWGEPAYRAAQIFRAVQKEGRLDPHEMTNLPTALRARLAEACPPAAKQVEVQTSQDGTSKFLFALADGRRVESVLIPEQGRTTVCVSSQVGCPIGCIFCASGVGGLIRTSQQPRSSSSYWLSERGLASGRATWC